MRSQVLKPDTKTAVDYAAMLMNDGGLVQFAAASEMSGMMVRTFSRPRIDSLRRFLMDHAAEKNLLRCQPSHGRDEQEGH